MYIKDIGRAKKPDLWRKNDINEEQGEKGQEVMNIQGQTQPIIFIINTDTGNIRDNKRYGRRRENGGNIFENIFYVFYKIKSAIKVIIIGAIIIAVIILISNPAILNNIMVGIFKKMGIYGIIMNIKKLIR